MDLPAKVKTGVSGCPVTRAESFVRDIGVQGKKSGWALGRPGIGDVPAEDLTTAQVLEIAKKSPEYHQANAKRRERTARFIERLLFHPDFPDGR